MLLPPDTLRVLHQSTTVPTNTIVMLVIIIVASFAFNSSSHAKIVADVDCLDRLHTVVEVLKGLQWGWGWDEFEAVVNGEIAVLPPPRAYAGSGGRTEDTCNPGLLGLPDVQKVFKDINKDRNNKCIPFHAHEMAVQ
ncbi:hypothetical protein EDD85DRAFT_798389 [Armillaria nabsnona]|nr:hypothetical protein EDD85DRAFT_798389 [Armillaria nabsnona]